MRVKKESVLVVEQVLVLVKLLVKDKKVKRQELVVERNLDLKVDKLHYSCVYQNVVSQTLIELNMQSLTLRI